MKITPDPYTPALVKTKSKPTPVKTGQNNTPQASQPTISDTKVQQKMRAWFSRVGISPALNPKDGRSSRSELDRRKQLIEIQKASNLQAVLNIALNVSITESNGESLDPDWFFSFSSMAEEIYSVAMQELWGKIFAVEISHPGSFSLRSLQTLKSLTHRDAKLFTRAASIASKRNNELVPRILVGYKKRKSWLSFLNPISPEQINLASVGVSYPDLLALQDMKLLYVSEIEGGEYAQGQQSKWRCGNHAFSLTSRANGTLLTYYKFTAVGAELYKLVGRMDNSQYLDALLPVLERGFEVDG